MRKSHIMRKKKEPAVIIDMLKAKKEKADIYETASVENSKKAHELPVEALRNLSSSIKLVLKDRSVPKKPNVRLSPDKLPVKAVRSVNAHPKLPASKNPGNKPLPSKSPLKTQERKDATGKINPKPNLNSRPKLKPSRTSVKTSEKPKTEAQMPFLTNHSDSRISAGTGDREIQNNSS